MPSEDRTRLALEALTPARDAFRSAVAAAADEVRAYRIRNEAVADPVASLGRELGTFAEGHIDTSRLAGLLSVESAPDPLTDRLMDVAHALFDELGASGAEAFHVEVPPGGDLRDVVRDALSGLGRAFGVSHAVEKARTHRYDPDRDFGLLHPYPFHRWAVAERRLAPPLVVTVQGDDLRAASLAEFMDGTFKLVLIVQGGAPAAPLARLIAGDAFVAQSSEGDVVARLTAHPGPGAVAWVEADSGAVAFVHDPAVGRRTWERIVLGEEPETLTARLEALEQRGHGAGATDLRHLLELASAPETSPATGAESAAADEGEGPQAADPADRLAAWLLARTDMQGL